MKKLKNISKKVILIFVGITIGATVSIYAVATWSTKEINSDINTNKVSDTITLKEIRNNLNYLKDNFGKRIEKIESKSMECVTGRARDNSPASIFIYKSTKNKQYVYSNVFGNARTNTNSGYYVKQWCKDDWIMTGCSAEGDKNDNDEAMIGDSCRSDQYYTNWIYTRCCRFI